MYFILSKVLLFIILPINWIFATLIIALVARDAKRRKRFLWITLVLLLVFTNPLLFDLYTRAWHVPDGKLNQKTYSCAIILGGFSGYKRTLAHPDSDGYFNGSADRFIQAVKLQTTGRVAHLLISGGNGTLLKSDNFAESVWVRSQLRELKFADSCILIDSTSRNTFENAAFSKQVIQKAHLQGPYILVTSAFHMRRSLLIFKKAGFDVIPYSCNYLRGTGVFKFDYKLLIPESDVLEYWEYYIKELVGWLETLMFKK